MQRFKFLSTLKNTNIEGALLLKGTHRVFFEEKFDGSRFGFELRDDGWHAFSRTGIDRIANVPYIEQELKELDLAVGTIFDCEVIVLSSDKKLRWELSRSVMGTKEYNKEALKAHLMIFDIQSNGLEDTKKLSYTERKKLIKELIGFTNKSTLVRDSYRLKSSKSYFATPLGFPITYLEDKWHQWVELQSGEGVMLKYDTIANYAKDWVKVKKEHTIDCFIISTTPGKGKYEGQVGALEVAVYNGDTIWPIGKISSLGDDKQRREITQLAIDGKLRYRTIEVRLNEVTKNFKLRHGRLVRWREDKEYKECSLEQLKNINK